MASIFSAADYTVAVICAVDKALFAVTALFDQQHIDLPSHSQDPNHYVLGQIGNHNVVTTALPVGQYGTNAASVMISHLSRTFPNVQSCLLVGTGGGAPSHRNDIRLGDVVVSQPTDTFPGVLQYDLGKEMESGAFILTGSLQRPPRHLLTAITKLNSDPDISSNPLDPYLFHLADQNAKYQHPGSQLDVLYTSECLHNPLGDNCDMCNGPYIERCSRFSNHPVVHYGLIASGNRVVKSCQVRDKIRDEHHIMCFEMEAAGVMNSMPCLVIRGICDYADSHKNNIWEEYACAAAAAYAKLLLTVLKSANGPNMPLTMTLCHESVCEISSSETVTSSPESVDNAGDNLERLVTATRSDHRLAVCKSFARRASSWEDWPTNAMDIFQKLQRWMSSPGSCLFIVGALPSDTKRARDLAFEVVDFLQSHGGYGVLYALSLPTGGCDSALEIYKSLIFQLVSQHPRLCSSLSQPSEEYGGEESFEMLKTVLSRAREVFIVIEGNEHCADRLVSMVLKIINNANSSMKVFHVTYDRRVHPAVQPSGAGLVESTMLPPFLPRSRRKTIGKRSMLWQKLNPRF